METLNGFARELLNPNKLSPDGTTTIPGFSPSLDGKILAYKLSEKGSDWFSINFINVDTMEQYADKMANTKFTRLSWSHDNKGIFYTVRKIQN